MEEPAEKNYHYIGVYCCDLIDQFVLCLWHMHMGTVKSFDSLISSNPAKQEQRLHSFFASTADFASVAFGFAVADISLFISGHYKSTVPNHI